MGVAGTRGGAAERLTAAYLELRGVEVVSHNVRVAGVEIDLVARDASGMAIVEVKYRSRSDFGGAAEAIDWRKRERLKRAARAMAAERGASVRVDVVAVDLEPEGLRLRHVKNAIVE